MSKFRFIGWALLAVITVGCAPVAAPPPPVITGLPVVGGALSVTTGGWQYNPDSYAFKWESCTAPASVCTAVGTDATTYTVAASDLGKMIRVRVTAANAAGHAAVTTAAVGPVTAPGTPPVAVNATDDTDDGTCDETHCSLREAIATANTDSAVDQILLPAGTFVVGSTAAAARSGSAIMTAQALGPQGEAFKVTEALTITGAGQGATIIDLSGEDFTIGWLTEASLTFASLTVRNLGTGTLPATRVLVAPQMTAPGGSVTFADTTVEGIQPDMAAGSGFLEGGWLVSGMPPGAVEPPDPPALPFDVRIESSNVRHIARNMGMVLNWGGDLDVIDSTITDTPALAAGYPIGIAAPPGTPGSPPEIFPMSLSVENSRLEGLAGYYSTCMGVGISATGGASVHVTGSAIVGVVSTSDASACGGLTGGIGPSIYLSGAVTATIDRSLVTIPPVVGNNLAALWAIGSCDEGQGGDSFVPSVTVQDSTLWSDSMPGVTYGGCNTTTPPTGTGVLLRRSTVTGVGTYAQPNNDSDVPGAPPLTLEASVIVMPPGSPAGGGCYALNGAGVGMVVSAGNNTAPVGQDPRWDCGLTAPGDQPDTDPMLRPLADNGGPTLTAAPLPASPLIDSAGTCSGFDQRGIARPQGTACDRGAVEVAP